MIVLITSAFATDPTESRANAVQPEDDGPDGGLDFFALFQARGTVNDLASTNPLLDGQVIGQLGGTNGIVVDADQRAAYTEQRVNAFFDYKPPTLDGKAGLSAAFEVDWAFGDRSYGIGGNTGAGFGADQVNLQTRRLHLDVYPRFGKGHTGHLVVGLQFVGDGVNDPTAVGPDGLWRSGGRLMFFASEAAGVTLYGRLHDAWGDRVRYKLGTYTLYEQGSSEPDDVWLNMADLQVHPAYATTLGLHAWYLQDRAAGTAGALGTGPTSALSELQGGPALDPFEGFAPPEDSFVHADLAWVGFDAGYNADLTHGAVGVHGTAFANLGRIYVPLAHDDSVAGALLDAEVRWRYAQGEGSVMRGEVLYSSGQNADRDTYTGIVTANSYGVAGAIYATHGQMLLFPDPTSINRMVAVVSDVSAGGRGVTGASASVGHDLVPDRLNATVGGAVALRGDSEPFGTEVNAHLSGEPLLFLNVGLHAGYVIPGAASGLTEAPWAVLLTTDWLVF